jgi:hypothetical protein
MLTLAMLFWIGYTLSAPAWYWWFWGINVFILVIRFGIDMYKRGSKL